MRHAPYVFFEEVAFVREELSVDGLARSRFFGRLGGRLHAFGLLKPCDPHQPCAGFLSDFQARRSADSDDEYRDSARLLLSHADCARFAAGMSI